MPNQIIVRACETNDWAAADQRALEQTAAVFGDFPESEETLELFQETLELLEAVAFFHPMRLAIGSALRPPVGAETQAKQFELATARARAC